MKIDLDSISRKVDPFARGRTLVVQYSWSLLWFSAFFLYANVRTNGYEVLPVHLLRFAFLLLLCIGLYRGSLICKWLLVLFTSCMGIIFISQADFKDWFLSLIFCIFAYVYVSCAYHLLFSKELNYYLSVKRKSSLE